MVFLIYVILLLLVVGDAIGDALIDQRKKRPHGLEVTVIGLWFLLMYYYSLADVNFWQIVLIYLSIRIYAFNVAYNVSRSLPAYYRGETDKIWDRWVNNIPTPIYSTILMVFVFLSIVFCFIF